MAEETSNGPDLAAGINTADVAEGSLVAGVFEGKPALLVNDHGRFCAWTGECTHLGAPLGTGIVVDGEVRCPWHHARFSLTTGEAVGAPAFSPLTPLRTSLQDGRVSVVATSPPASRQAAQQPAPRVVIVGGGAGGHACAELLRRSGYGGSVAVVSDDEDAPYDRTSCSKQYLSGMMPRQDLMLPSVADEGQGAAVDRFTLRLHRRVGAIDVDKGEVVLDTSERLPYDVLVLATGADPTRPHVPGFDLPNVHLLRTLRDADTLIDASGRARRVAIIGASFIGLEAAAALKQRHLDVHVVAPDELPLGRLLGPDVGTLIKTVHEEKGVVFHLGHEVRSFDGATLTLDDGSTLAADFVVLGAGVTPRTELAEDAGLHCASGADGGGVVVNQRLETSRPNIYAIGDIARYPDPHSGQLIRVEHWVHAQRQGQHVARLIMGETASYQEIPFFWSAHFDTGFRYVGHVGSVLDSHTDGSIGDRNFAVCYTGEHRERAYLTCNRDIEALYIEAGWEESDSAESGAVR